jgi:probable HAF family extracellular repeat protein
VRIILTSIAASGLFAAIAIAQPARSYSVRDLGTLGGDTSFAFGINDLGWVAGSSNLTAGGPQHGFIWFGGGRLIDIGTLGGPNSGTGGPNLLGWMAVGSETAVNNGPTGEDFCGYGTHRQCLGAVWKNGVLKALPNLPGGQNANAFELNNLGQVVGFAETGVSDATCVPGTPFQTKRFSAVIWDANGAIRQLPPLKGDTVSFAFGINDFGQVVGSSGLCSNTSLPPNNPAGAHAVLWEKDGTPIDLGNLGGTYNVASSINELGEVVGGAISPKDGVIHAFRWTRATGMGDFGAFPGSFVTVPPCCNTINNRGEIAGFSIEANGTRALVWQGKTPVDLNTLVPKGSPFLQSAGSLNDFGDIVGQESINGQGHAFVVTPR